MCELRECVLQIPESVRQDVTTFRETVARYLAGELDETRFKAKRVPMGIYQQRTGAYMVRVRIGAGIALPAQIRAIAAVSRRFGPAHVTTRQDIQIHDVPIEATPDIFDELLAANLTSRGGGGNTVRNVSASPRAGVDPDQVFDVRPYAIAATEYLLDFPTAYNLPRKFKLAFSDKAADDAFASVADIGFFAHIRESRKGFAVYAGGGLGGSPRTGVLIEEWVPVESVPLVAEAVRRVFDKHGDRGNKHAARLRFVLDRFGEERFREEYRNEKKNLNREGVPGTPPVPRMFPSSWRDKLVDQARILTPNKLSPFIMPETMDGFYTIQINPRHGLVTADALETIARLTEENGEGLIRTTQQQELLLCGVPGGLVDETLGALRGLDKDIFDEARPSVVACAGAATCKLGLCLSRGLAEVIHDRFTGNTASSLPPIRISGCPNSCGNHQIAKLGFAGKARRIEGRLMPFYDVMAEGCVAEGKTRLAQQIASIPARAVPDFLAEAKRTGKYSEEYLQTLAMRYETLPNPIPEDYYHDWGSNEPFSLAGRGPGECGAGTLDIIRVDLETAKGHLAAARNATSDRERDEALHGAVFSVARALLPVFGLEPKTHRETFRDFSERLIKPGWVDPAAQALINTAQDWKAGDRETLTDVEADLSALIERVEALFVSLDGHLQFRLAPVSNTDPMSDAAKSPQDAEKDLRGVACPLNFVKAKVALENAPVGGTLDFLLDHGDPANNIPASFREQGQEVMAVESEANHVRVRVRRSR